MEFSVAKKIVEIKFDYRLMFKIDKDMATKDANGQSDGNGVGALFFKIVNRDDQGIVDSIQYCASKKGKAVSEDEALAAIEARFEKSESEDPQEELFQEIEEEMVQSGFFQEEDFEIYRKHETWTRIGTSSSGSWGSNSRSSSQSNFRNYWQDGKRGILTECAKLGLTDQETILEGLYYRQIEEREALSGLALELRYTLNAKKVDAKKLSKKRDKDKVRRIFHPDKKKEIKNKNDFVALLEKASQMFANRN